jgi:SOS response regulatory protein OraA/RecX
LKAVLDRKAVGRLRLFQELVRNGVAGDLAREVLDELEDDDDARIERALAKLEAMRPADGYAQLGRRLERLGFGAPNIARALRRSAERRGTMPDHIEALE